MSSLIHKILRNYISEPETLMKAQAEVDKIVNFEKKQLEKMTNHVHSMTMEIDQYKIELEKNQEKMLQQSKLSTIGEVTATLSHEFNNQMMVLQGNASLVKLLVQGQPNSQKLESILSASERTLTTMAQLIKDIKKFSHQSKNETLNLEKGSPCNLIQESINVCTTLIKNANIEIRYSNKIDNDFECMIPTELGQVFLNLIKNAHDFVVTDEVPAGQKWIGVESYTTINPQTQAPVVKVEFSNYGSIPQHVKEKLFTPFFTTKEVGKGTGLGLGISKKILEMMKGHIHLENENNVIKFVVEFPVCQKRTDCFSKVD